MNDQFTGIVIAYREYRENDALLQVLSEEGIIVTIVAKGIQKVKSKNSGACQLFTYSRFLLNYHEQSTMQSLRSAEIIHSYRLIREDLFKQCIASYMCEVIEKSGFEENVYSFLQDSLQFLETSQNEVLLLCMFQATINRMHGIEPYVDGCVRCGSEKGIKAISLDDGGFICTNCLKEGDTVQTPFQLKLFRLLNKADLKHYSSLENSVDVHFDDFLNLYEFFAQYAGVNVKSIRFLKHLYTMDKGS